MRIRVLLPIVFVSLLLPSFAAAQRWPTADSARLSVFTGGGFAGQEELSIHNDRLGSTLTGSADLTPTPLVGARFEAPIVDFIALGAQFRSAFWRTQDAKDNGDKRNPLLDFDLTAKIRWGFHTGSLVFEPYVIMPVGFSLAIWNKDVNLGAGLDRANPGWNIGALGGLTLIAKGGFGAFVEFGWMHHAGYDRDDADNKYTITLNQLTLHTGFTFAF